MILSSKFGRRKTENNAVDYCPICTICTPRPRRTGTVLDTSGVIQTDPACTGFQLAPAFRGTRAGKFRNNGEHPLAGVLPGLRIVRARTLADIEIADGHPDCIRDRRGLGHRIGCLTIRVEDIIARILIRTLLRIGEVMECALLERSILPALTHTVPARNGGAAAGGGIVLCQIPTLDDIAEILHIGVAGSLLPRRLLHWVWLGRKPAGSCCRSGLLVTG